jgi:hypothetical protein
MRDTPNKTFYIGRRPGAPKSLAEMAARFYGVDIRKPAGPTPFEPPRATIIPNTEENSNER